MDELKPCPFCGGEAEYQQKKVRIICKKCEAQIVGAKAFKFTWNYPNYLARLWNRRAEHE